MSRGGGALVAEHERLQYGLAEGGEVLVRVPGGVEPALPGVGPQDLLVVDLDLHADAYDLPGHALRLLLGSSDVGARGGEADRRGRRVLGLELPAQGPGVGHPALALDAP